MTEARKLKQAIRARAAKTGERYTAARAHVLKALQKRARPATPPPAPPSASPVAPAGVRDSAIRAKTGRGFDHWFAVLDVFGAAEKGHTASARHLSVDHGVPGWHAQGITVAYERARGLRAVNQTTTGFQVAISRMVPASLETVLSALRAPARRRWLANADPALRRALAAALTPKARGLVRGPRRSRLRYEWDGTGVELVFEPRATGTSVVASNTRLRSAAEVAERRAQWRAALDALRAHLVR